MTNGIGLWDDFDTFHEPGAVRPTRAEIEAHDPELTAALRELEPALDLVACGMCGGATTIALDSGRAVCRRCNGTGRVPRVETPALCPGCAKPITPEQSIRSNEKRPKYHAACWPFTREACVVTVGAPAAASAAALAPNDAEPAPQAAAAPAAPPPKARRRRGPVTVAEMAAALGPQAVADAIREANEILSGPTPSAPLQPAPEAPATGGGPTPASSPAAQLRDRWWKLKEGRVRVDGPSMTTRVSAIGEECERKLFYARTVPAKDRVAHGPALQAIFDLGNHVERFVIRELEDLGAEVVQRGRDYLDRDRELSAHTDVRVRMPGWKRALVAEIKGLNPATAGQIETIDDVRHHRQAWVRKYFAQLQGYLGMDALSRLLDDGAPMDALDVFLEPGLFVLQNKSTGILTFIDCPADLEVIHGLFRKAERIRDAVRAGAPPDRHVSDDCARCPFNLVCAPPMSFGPGAEFLSEELAAILERRDALKAAHAEYDALHEEAKSLIPAKVGEYAAGPYFIRVTERSRKATAAVTFLNREIKKNGA